MNAKEKEQQESAEFYRLGQDDFKRGITLKEGLDRARKLHQREAYAKGFRDAFQTLAGVKK